MVNDRRYKAPPIVEAVFECQFSESVSERQTEKVISKIKKNYSSLSLQRRASAHVNMSDKQVKFEDVSAPRLTSDDQADVFIFYPDSIIWAKLAPYAGGDNFIDRIMRDFEILKSVCGLRKLNRLGLRYINRIDVPRSGVVVNYEDYITINLSLPNDLDPVNSYGWSFERPFAESNMLAKVQSASMMPEIPNTMAFLLDIDIIAQSDLPVKLPDLRLKIDVMRKLKNKIFELCITDKARESFL